MDGLRRRAPGDGPEAHPQTLVPGLTERRRALLKPWRIPGAARLSAMFPRCGDPKCRRGPVRLGRNRRAPVFEGRWACSPECLRAVVEAAITREGQEERTGSAWIPRMPVGLILLEQGRIREEHLRQARRNRQGSSVANGGALRMEEWLLNSGLLSEAALTRAMGAQWNCPVFSLTQRNSAEMTAAVPPFLAEALGALPVRIAGGKLLYLAFSERIDRSLSYAVEHVTGLRVAAGIARKSEFGPEQARYLAAGAPRTRLLEAGSRRALAGELAAWLEQEQPVEARLARVHELWWLRIWRSRQGAALPAAAMVEDLLATVGGQELEENAVPPIRKAEDGGASCPD